MLFGRHRSASVFLKMFVLWPLALLGAVGSLCAGFALGAFLVFSRDLPEIPNIVSYQPRTVSTFYADDGTVIGIFYKQKRFVVDLKQIPPHVVRAFLAAEDAHFFEHNGVDWQGLIRAFLRNIRAGRIVQGGSTITMQVTRNFLLSRERSISRKVKEIVLAQRLERLWGKDKILYIYLNEIYLGEGNYGVEAASRGYFDKPVEHLSLAEGALLAGLVASPARFNPFKSEELARNRQLTVLGRMLKAGFITDQEYQQAKEQVLLIRREVPRPFDLTPDFAEAVRRYIVKKYGEEKLYNEGLKVFTTCRVDYQKMAQNALEKGLAEIKGRQKHLAILRTVPVNQINELLQRRATPNLTDDKIYQGVVVKINRKGKDVELQVALSTRMKGIVSVPAQSAAVYKVGQVLALRFEHFSGETPVFTLDDNPQLQGSLVCIENRTGYVRALVGGVGSGHFKFNRAIQAKRQPGSAFKPIIYSVALEEKSYSPATIIVDEPIVVDLEGAEEEWEPKNAGGDFLGPLSFRRALELSRNICTIKILMDVGFDPVIQMAKRMGITSPLGRNLSLSLGTSELSLMELTTAYTVFPNSGIYVEPILVKRVEDRFGNVLEDNSEFPVLEASQIPQPVPREEFRELVAQYSRSPATLEDEDEPALGDLRGQPSGQTEIDQRAESGQPRGGGDKEGAKEARRTRAVMSPQTAYIMTSLLQGGVRQGTGARVSQYVRRKDLAGKTGTTNNSEDTWFIGFNPYFTTGVWVGFDEKRPVGRREEGARAALAMRLSRSFGVCLSALAKIPSSPPYWLINFAAVFSPTPGTPGRLRSTAKATATCTWATCCAGATA
jgi:penicillin-binding protein 1A